MPEVPPELELLLLEEEEDDEELEDDDEDDELTLPEVEVDVLE
ncbi:hypothetical protein [Tsuneonella dongtanensis]|nr:hypothetical protein [Tsuneonella dongtanensis]